MRNVKSHGDAADSRGMGRGRRPFVRGCLMDCLMILLGLASLLYLLNLSVGFVELLPDNLPVAGNMDEAAAAWLLLFVLGYFGVDTSGWIEFVRRMGGRRRIGAASAIGSAVRREEAADESSK